MLLRLVEEDNPADRGAFELLLIKPGFSKIVRAEFNNVEVPLIALALADFWHPGDLIDGGDELGVQVSVTVEIMVGGRRHIVTGIPTMLDGLGLVLPPGSLD